MALAPTVKALLVLDAEGARICSKYYGGEWPTLDRQIALEKQLFAKTRTSRGDVEVVLFDKVMAVYKHSGDIFLYIIGAPEENELILSSVLSCLEESLQTLFNSDAVESAQLDKRTLIENLDMLLLTVDEIIDEGIILEIDSQQVAQRVSLRGPDVEVPLGEQTFTQALETAKSQFFRSFR